MPVPTQPVDRCLACGSPRVRRRFEVPTQMHSDREPFSFAECGGCGLVYLAERVAADELSRYYRRSYLPYRGARAWGPFAPLVRLGQRRLDRSRTEVALEAARLGPESVVLDVGCGRPTFLAALQARVGCRCLGVDFSSHGWESDASFEMIELIRAEPASLDPTRLGTAAAAHGGDAGVEGSGAASVDLITMWHYLEHDYEPRATLEHLRTLSHEETRLVVEVPNHASRSRRAWGRDWAGYHAPRHTAAYTPATLRTMLEEAGWTVVSEQPGTLDPHLLWWLSLRERGGAEWSGSMARWLPEFILAKLVMAPVRALTRHDPDVLLAIAVPARPRPRPPDL